jgi:hypothetical protein
VNIPAKITLSELESTLISNPHWILTKNEVLRKVTQLFGQLSERYHSNPAVAFLPEEVRTIPPKISRGEQYKGLPYLILDFPRYFDPEHTFAIRTFFWWGHYFASTIQLKGRYREQFANQILKVVSSQDSIEWMINKTEAEWIHDLSETDHWEKLSDLNAEEGRQRNVFKVAASLSVQKWDEAEQFLNNIHSIYMEGVGMVNCQVGGTNL